MLDGLSKKRGRTASNSNPLANEVAQLQKENQRLKDRLTQAYTIIDVQKKLSQLLGLSKTDLNSELS